jgi:hypothetical protein
MRPSTFHSPGLPDTTNGMIAKILRQWRKSEQSSPDKGKKKR